MTIYNFIDLLVPFKRNINTFTFQDYGLVFDAIIDFDEFVLLTNTTWKQADVDAAEQILLMLVLETKQLFVCKHTISSLDR